MGYYHKKTSTIIYCIICALQMYSLEIKMVVKFLSSFHIISKSLFDYSINEEYWLNERISMSVKENINYFGGEDRKT